MNVRTTAAALAGTAGLALVVGACGGGGSGTTKAEYVRKGNAVCTNQKSQLDALPAPAVDVQSNDLTKAELTEVANFFDAGVKVQRATVAKLRRLDAPRSDASELTTVYDRADKGADEIEHAAKAARAGDLKQLRSSVEAGTNDLDAAQHEINAYGLDKCGNA